MPSVEVEGARLLSFPITEEQASSLAKIGDPAPYGRGERTLVDRSVRACRQIDAAAAVLQAAPDFGSQEEQIAAQLKSWEATSAAGDKLVWLLEHEYSEAGLSFDVLKNADAALGRVLARAAQHANHALYAAILSIYEWGTLEESGDVPDWNQPTDDWETVERIDSTRSLVGLIAPDGSRPDYGALVRTRIGAVGARSRIRTTPARPCRSAHRRLAPAGPGAILPPP